MIMIEKVAHKTQKVRKWENQWFCDGFIVLWWGFQVKITERFRYPPQISSMFFETSNEALQASVLFRENLQ